MPTDNVTANRNWQLPNGGNNLDHDVARLIAALQAADVDVAAILSTLVLKAPILNAALAGTPTAPTPGVADNSTKIATTAWARLYFADFIGAAPAALDTIAELATALQNNPDIITQMLASIGLRALAANPTFTGKVLLPTGVAGTAPLRLPVPSANPSAPVSGDVWPDVTSGAWKYRLTSTTLTFGALELAQTWTAAQTFAAGAIITSGALAITTTAGQAIGVAGGPAANTAAILINSLTGVGNAAFISLNRQGSFAANFGIDTDNKWKVGGWSMGAVAYEIVHMGNYTTLLNGTYPNVGAAVAGDIIYGSAAGVWGRLAKSTDGLFLKLSGGFPAWGSSRVTTTAVVTTSGAAIDITGIPSWATEIKVALQGVSTNGTAIPIVQMGTAGGIEVTGYVGSVAAVGTATACVNITDGLRVTPQAVATADTWHGIATLVLQDASTNTWSMTWVGATSNFTFTTFSGGTKALSGVLDRIRLTTQGGANTFDAGKLSVSYS